MAILVKAVCYPYMLPGPGHQGQGGLVNIYLDVFQTDGVANGSLCGIVVTVSAQATQAVVNAAVQAAAVSAAETRLGLTFGTGDRMVMVNQLSWMIFTP